ncbi:MAG: hypothetical protein INF85_04450 [Roseomonas sp.]|jgi:AraC-like DNA-binding protein|nr:hypothetical protein [Roseomonas sp.]MCA3455952.1 hypothetical protein [Rhodobacter sp.]
MSLGDRIDFVGGSYEIRGLVDGLYVVRIRNRTKNHEAYRVWTEQDRAEFDKMQQGRADNLDRNAQIYERRLSGETLATLAQDFGLSVSRVRDICAKQERKERRGQPVPA